MLLSAQASFAGRASRPGLPRRATRAPLVARAAAGPSVDIEEGKRLMDQEGYRFLDIRSAREYDREHITKPPHCAFNVPWEGADFVGRVARACPSKATKMLVACDDGGSASQSAVQQLQSSGYTGAVLLEGGYSAWTQVFSTSGRRRPPPGRWVSSGKEALKSGLNIPGVAESYDEGGNLTKARYASGWRDGPPQ